MSLAEALDRQKKEAEANDTGETNQHPGLWFVLHFEVP